MGCGCGRSTRSKVASLKLKNKRLKSLMKTVPHKNVIDKRTSICLSCSYSAPTKREKKSKIRICHKLNRLLINISRNKTIKCPKGKF